MAEEFSMTVSGIEETCAMLEAAPRNIAKAAFARALAAAAVPVVKALEARTPADTGKLKASIVTDVAVDAAGGGGIASIGFGKQGHVANFVEYGHRMVSHKPHKKEIGTVAPHPFMRPAAAAAAEPAIDAFCESVRESFSVGIADLPGTEVA
jgi:HK97 gp10 family phage protein